MYTFTDLTLWSTVENGLGLTASSIATLRPLFKGLLGLTRSSALSRHGVRKPFRSKDIVAGLDAPGRNNEVGLSPPRRAAFRGRRDDDGDSDSNDLLPLAPTKCSHQRSAIYERKEDVLEHQFDHVSAREAYTRPHSDGSWHYRMGGGEESSRENSTSNAQGFSSHKKQSSV